MSTLGCERPLLASVSINVRPAKPAGPSPVSCLAPPCRFYERQQKSAGHHFKWLGLTAQAATSRRSDVAPLALQGGGLPAPPPPPPRSLKGVARKVRTLQHLLGGVQESKAAAWAKQHAEQVEAGAAEELRARRAAVAAAEEARAAAAAAVARRLVHQPAKGKAAGNAFAAIVQLAAQARQAEQQAAEGAAGRSGACAPSQPVAGGQRRKPKLPPLSLQKLTQRWAKAAAASSAAAGEASARQKQQAAEAERLQEQWAAVQGRLPVEKE